MTTKYKIIAGFTIMVLLLAVGSVLGYTYLGKSRDGLVEYRRLARMNVRISDASFYLMMAASGANSFMNSGDPAAMAAAAAALDDMDRQFVNARKDMKVQANVDLADRLREEGRAYKKGLLDISEAVKAILDQYRLKVVPGSDAMARSLLAMSEASELDGNFSLLQNIETAWSEYSLMLFALGRYYSDRTDTDRDIILRRGAALEAVLKKMDASIALPEARDIYANKLLPAAEDMLGAAGGLIQAAGRANALLTRSRAEREAFARDIEAMSVSYDQRMDAYGKAVTTESEDGQTVLLGGSAIGLLVGTALALFIILGMSRVLRDAGSFAEAIAKGNFTRTVNVREGGEIGVMVAALRQIPVVLDRLVRDSHNLADNILGGRLRQRLDDAAFSGSFADLTTSVNAISDAFTTLMDDLGVPVMCCDKDKNIVFLSKEAQKALGGDLTSRKCSAELKAGSCDNDGCLGICAMARRGMVEGETVIHPRGQTMQVRVVAIPLYNRKREIIGFTEVITDLSAIKEKQEIMLQVAGEASGISNRIAAAAEELSAQVEQISRGTEVQRDRVSSTAGAMAEMNSTVLEVARNAGSASEQSENTRQKARHGENLVNQVMAAINTVNAVGRNLHDNMQDLGKQAESIGDVMNVISDIADQTNLLALNAAIEAARAGEAGRGFAVVADEVRKLAEKTMHATYEVGSSIRAVQQSANVNIAEVSKAVSSVAEVNKLAISSGEALTEIVSLASSNSSVVASIATAAEEQSSTSEEISQSTEEISRIVAETARSMVQSAAAVRELSGMAQELRGVMERLK